MASQLSLSAREQPAGERVASEPGSLWSRGDAESGASGGAGACGCGSACSWLRCVCLELDSSDSPRPPVPAYSLHADVSNSLPPDEGSLRTTTALAGAPGTEPDALKSWTVTRGQPSRLLPGEPLRKATAPSALRHPGSCQEAHRWRLRPLHPRGWERSLWAFSQLPALWTRSWACIGSNHRPPCSVSTAVPPHPPAAPLQSLTGGSPPSTLPPIRRPCALTEAAPARRTGRGEPGRLLSARVYSYQLGVSMRTPEGTTSNGRKKARLRQLGHKLLFAQDVKTQQGPLHFLARLRAEPTSTRASGASPLASLTQPLSGPARPP